MLEAVNGTNLPTKRVSLSRSLSLSFSTLCKQCIFCPAFREAGVVINLAGLLSFRHHSRAASGSVCASVCVMRVSKPGYG